MEASSIAIISASNACPTFWCCLKNLMFIVQSSGGRKIFALFEILAEKLKFEKIGFGKRFELAILTPSMRRKINPFQCNVESK